MRRVVLLLVGILMSWASASMAADPLTVGFSYSKPPYVYATEPFKPSDYDVTGDRPGVEFDIVRAALAARSLTFTPQFMSSDQLNQHLQDGRIDAVATVRPEVPTAFYSDNFVRFRNYAITRKDFGRPIKDIRDLAGTSTVAWQGAHFDLGKDFEAATKTTDLYREFVDQQTQVLGFLKKRANVIVIDNLIFRHWAQTLGSDPDSFVFHDIFPEHTTFVVGFTSERMRDEFNLGLREIKRSGVYADIYRKYGAE